MPPHKGKQWYLIYTFQNTTTHRYCTPSATNNTEQSCGVQYPVYRPWCIITTKLNSKSNLSTHQQSLRSFVSLDSFGYKASSQTSRLDKYKPAVFPLLMLHHRIFVYWSSNFSDCDLSVPQGASNVNISLVHLWGTNGNKLWSGSGVSVLEWIH